MGTHGKLALTILVLIILFPSLSNAECYLSTQKIPKNIMGLQLLHSEDKKGWARVADLKPDWVRMEVHWNLLEPNENQYDWTLSDITMPQMMESKTPILLLINNMPDWALNSHTPEIAFSQFLRSFMTRYKDYLTFIHAYEIFNEPNYPGFGWMRTNRDVALNADINTNDSMALFSRFLEVSNQTIRTFDKDAFIVSGGLSSEGTNVENYIAGFLNDTTRNCIDIIGYHPYGDRKDFVGKQNALEKFSGKTVWFTEYGTTENDERTYLVNLSFDQLAKLNAFFWFNDRDTHVFTETYGLTDYFGYEKKDYYTYRQRQADRVNNYQPNSRN